MPLSSKAEPEIIAHRGASYEAPENTLAALRLGWEETDSCEIDVHLSADNEIVVLHDASTKRTTGHEGEVARQSLAELRRLDAGSWKNKKWKNERIPTLREVLAAMPPSKKLAIEIKSGASLVPVLAAILKESKIAPDRITIIAFDYPTISLAKKSIPGSRAFWLASYKKDPATGRHPDLDSLIQKAKTAGVDGMNLDFKFPIDAAFTDKIKKAGLKLFVWTVDDPDIARKLAEAGVDGITTNRPAFIRSSLSEISGKAGALR